LRSNRMCYGGKTH